MTREQAREHLSQYLKAKRKLEVIKRSLEELETQITSITVSYGSKVQVTPEPDKLADVIEKLSRLRNEMIISADEAADLMEDTYKEILSIRDLDVQSILFRTYIIGEDLKEIDMGYSYRQVLRLHERGLDIVGAKLE